MDFGALPPEVNSGRMYIGPGAQSLVTAAASWDSLAGELHAVAASYRSTLADLTAEWRGPSSAAMMSGVAPYVNWVTATAAQAEQTAAQAKAAAAAYENAFIATVPPAAVATNRSQLAVLVATNLFGQNTAAIAANEAHYAEMWAQDAAAMYIYAASSSAASSLTPFKPAPPTTDQGATAVQPLTASAAQASPATSQLLQGLATTAATSAPTQPFFTPAEVYYTLLTSFFNGTIGPLSPVKLFGPFGSFYDLGVQSFLAPFNNFNMQAAYGAALNSLPAAAGGMSGLGTAASAASAVSAEMGQAGAIAGLSVPASWAGPGPALASLVSPVAPNSLGAASTAIAADAQGSIASNLALSGMAGRAMTGVDASAPRTVGGGAGVVAAETTTATIIVIPED